MTGVSLLISCFMGTASFLSYCRNSSILCEHFVEEVRVVNRKLFNKPKEDMMWDTYAMRKLSISLLTGFSFAKFNEL